MQSMDTIDKLDTEFLYYCEQIQKCYKGLPKILQVRVEAWTRMLAVQSGPDSWIVDRNLHAQLLLQCVQTGDFRHPFDKKPHSDVLPKLPPDVVLQLTSSRVYKKRAPVKQEPKPSVLQPMPKPNLSTAPPFPKTRPVRHEQVQLGWAPVPPPPFWPGAGREQGVQVEGQTGRGLPHQAASRCVTTHWQQATAVAQDDVMQQLQAVTASLQSLQYAVSQLQAHATSTLAPASAPLQQGRGEAKTRAGHARARDPSPVQVCAAAPRKQQLAQSAASRRAPAAPPVPPHTYEQGDTASEYSSRAGQVTLDGSTASASDMTSPRPPANPTWNVKVTPLSLPTGPGPLREALLAALGEIPVREPG